SVQILVIIRFIMSYSYILYITLVAIYFFFSSRRRHTRSKRDWSSDVCSSDLAKTIVIDGKIASVGTANIDVRSFRLNFEVNAFVYDVPLAKKLEEAFERDVLLSTQMTKHLYEQRSLGIKFKESISRLLSP